MHRPGKFNSLRTALVNDDNMSSVSLLRKCKIKCPIAVPQKRGRFKGVFVNRVIVVVLTIKARRLAYQGKHNVCVKVQNRRDPVSIKDELRTGYRTRTEV